ncbi:uncharacterized protein KZ484_018411 isoform 2-T3 [Pholidichthys leucotaenia]
MLSYADRLAGSNGPEMAAANGSEIKTFGERTLLLSLHGRAFEWTFVVAALNFNILARVTRPTAQANVTAASESGNPNAGNAVWCKVSDAFKNQPKTRGVDECT